MQTGYYSAAGGMVAQFNRLDTIANNLANVNTSGYKKDKVITGDFMRIYQEKRDELSLDNNTKESAAFYNRTITRVPQIVDSFTDFTNGTIKKTDNTLDFALSRDGLFFAVKTPQGIRLTRDGSFSVDDDGRLVTKQGYEVLSNDYLQSAQGIKLDVTQDITEVDKNGMFYSNIPGTSKLVQNKRLMIVHPENLNTLKKEGDSLYIPESTDFNRVPQSGAVRQGFVEGSNVNAVHEMTALIEANRLVGMYQKVMDSQMNDLNNDAITKLASTRA